MSQKHALVVDGQPTTLAVISRLFRSEGFAVQPAKTSREALKCLSERSFHVIAAGHDMVPITGIDLWALVKREQRHVATQFLLVTTIEHRERLLATRTELPVILCRPFGADALRRALRGDVNDNGETVFEI